MRRCCQCQHQGTSAPLSAASSRLSMINNRGIRKLSSGTKGTGVPTYRELGRKGHEQRMRNEPQSWGNSSFLPPADTFNNQLIFSQQAALLNPRSWISQEGCFMLNEH